MRRLLVTTLLPPDDARGADLFWWRCDGGFRTLVTLYGPAWAPHLEGDRLRLRMALFDVAGGLRASGEASLGKAEALFLDHARLASILGCDPCEGVLAVFPVGARDRRPSMYRRLASLCDWSTDDGDLVSFHNDQSWLRGLGAIGLTEIVIAPGAGRTEIVIANGPEPQAPACTRLWVQNHRGARRYAACPEAMAPFSLTRIDVDALFPGLDAFMEGRAVTVSGRLAVRDLFVRPWVITHGSRLSGYHGGDLHPMKGVPAALSFCLPYRLAWLDRVWPRAARAGRAWMNPGAVIHRRGLTTAVYLLNSHGDVEDDFWVDVRLHDAQGRLVAERERWLLARRNGVTRGEIRDLLPDASTEFTGHVALRFSRALKRRFPQLLQALFEYRTEQSAARTMLWSDDWNTVARLRAQRVPLRVFYRAIVRPPLLSHVVVSNCGMAADYDRTATLRILLEDGDGRSLVHDATLAPHATLFASILDLFPGARAFLGDRPAGIVVVESAFDLASLHFTRHERSGVWGVEHEMALWTLDEDGRWHVPSG